MADPSRPISLAHASRSGQKTLLHLAVQEGNIEGVRHMLSLGKEATRAQDGAGYTPLHYAAGLDRLDIVQLLVESGADATIRNKEGLTAGDIASTKGFQEVTQFLSKRHLPSGVIDQDSIRRIFNQDPKLGANVIELHRKELAKKQEQHGTKPHMDVAAAFVGLALSCQHTAIKQEAIEHYESSLAIMEKLDPTKAEVLRGTVEALQLLREVYQTPGDALKAASCAQRLSTFLQGISKKEVDRETFDTLAQLTHAFIGAGQVRETIEVHRSATAVAKKLGLGDQPDCAELLMEQAASHRDLKNHEQELTCYELALKIRKETYKEGPHPGLVNIHLRLAYFWAELGNSERALQYYRPALKMQRELCGDGQDRSMGDMLYNMGLAHSRMHRLDQSLDCLKEALVIYKATLGDNAPETIMAKGCVDKLEAARSSC